MSSFFEPVSDGVWRATEHTVGPWDSRFQHGGPPSALLGRAVERCRPRPEMLIARLTVEILGPVPVGDLTVRCRVRRPGRNVELVEAVAAAGGRDCLRAAAWRITRIAAAGDGVPTSDVVVVPDRHRAPPPLQEASEPAGAVWEGAIDGYLSAVQWRFAHGSFLQPGPATAWTRLRHPIVADEEPTGLQRVLAVADSGNGLSGELDLSRFHFINPELTVHLHREPVGDWVCVDAQTAISPGGAGLATTVLSDQDGPVGVGAQSLLVAARA